MAHEDGTSLYDRALGLAPRPTEFGKQEIDGMPRKLALAFGAVGLVAGAMLHGTPAQAQGVKAGVLTCNVASGFGFIFGSSKSVNCTFAPAGGGPPQHYVGSIDKFGVDIGYTSGGVLVWTVQHGPCSIAAAGSIWEDCRRLPLAHNAGRGGGPWRTRSSCTTLTIRLASCSRGSRP